MEISSEEFKALLPRERYIFHVHTGYTDGQSTVGDYFEWAAPRGYEAIIFTEHARADISYDFGAFLDDIEDAGKRFPWITAVAGAETKLLPGGRLDISDDVSSMVRVIGIACHSFPGDIGLYERSFEALLKSGGYDGHILVWVHPGRFLKRLGLLDGNTERLAALVRMAARKGVFIERSLREGLPPGRALKGIPPGMVVTGCDAHSTGELERLLGGSRNGNKKEDCSSR